MEKYIKKKLYASGDGKIIEDYPFCIVRCTEKGEECIANGFDDMEDMLSSLEQDGDQSEGGWMYDGCYHNCKNMNVRVETKTIVHCSYTPEVAK